MKNILKNKILIILTIFAVILGFGSNVFAFSNIDFSYNNNNYVFSSKYINSLNISSEKNIIYIMRGSSSNTDQFIMIFTNNSDVQGQYDCWSGDFIRFTLSGLSNDDYSSFTFQRGGSGGYTPSWIIYSNADLYNHNGELVFQGAPQEQAQELTLVPIVEQAETEKTMAEILGILPLVVSLLVSIIAIRKAISFLRSVLRAS